MPKFTLSYMMLFALVLSVLLALSTQLPAVLLVFPFVCLPVFPVILFRTCILFFDPAERRFESRQLENHICVLIICLFVVIGGPCLFLMVSAIPMMDVPPG